jgi:hypothetical protein
VALVTAAIFGLLGVLVGGVLNFVTVLYLQGRKDKSAIRSIARLAYDDCLHFQSTLVRALAENTWWPKGEVITPQVGAADRKVLLGGLGDTPSQDVASAIGWAAFITLRRDNTIAKPTPVEFQMMRHIFCRLDLARWQLSGKPSGRRFRSFTDGGVLATVTPPTTLDALGISDEQCRVCRQQNYGRTETA